MRKFFIIARSNMRNAKGQIAAIVALVVLAALLMNLWLMLAMDYRANFDRYHDKLNAEHVTLAVEDCDGTVREYLQRTLDEKDGISQFVIDDCMSMATTFPYGDGTMNTNCVFMTKDVALSRKIGRSEIVEEGDCGSGIYLPMLYKTDDYCVGRTIEITIGSHTVAYTVCGFLNNVMIGSHNCVLAQFILTQDKYDELSDLGYAPKAVLCSIRLKDISQNLNTEAELKTAVSKQFPDARMNSNCYDTVGQSRYIAQNIISSIMSAMAFFVLLIALVVIISNIINFIQVGIKNLGALKAIGYTSRQLVCSLLLQFFVLTVVAAIVGTALSYALFPTVNVMMISQTGIPYAIRFLPLPMLISIAILSGSVALCVWLSARRIKKIEPIVALRSGVRTHSFKRNRVPLEKTKAPLNLALALKTTLSGIKHNLTVCITMLVLSLIIVFSGLMVENVIVDMTPFLDLIMGESADSCINVQTTREGDFLATVNADARVEKIYLYHSVNISHVGGAELLCTMCDDFFLLNNQRVVYKGRFPKYDNEIAIGAKYAKVKGLEVGDEIEITVKGMTEKYLICGFTQISNNLGRDCLMTRKGYERFGELLNLTFYINLVDGTDIDSFNEQMQKAFSDDVNAVLNIDTTVEAAASVYVSLMTIVVMAILVISVVIITFVLYLLVRTMLTNKMRDYGILKSLGFTTKQLIVQTAMSFMPALVISTVIGMILSCLVINPLMSLFLSSIGIVKCTFAVPVVFSVFSGIGLILLSFGIACLLSLRIRKIAPRALLVGE